MATFMPEVGCCAVVPAYDQYKDCPTCVAASDYDDHDWSRPCPMCNRRAVTVIAFAPPGAVVIP